MDKNEKYGILVGAAPLGAEKNVLIKLLREGNCILAAADGGLSFCMKEGIEPGLWVGDADSLGSFGITLEDAAKAFPSLDLSPCSSVKDDSDMWLGTEKLISEGIRKIYVFGGLGGTRWEHTVANMQLMYGFIQKGIRIVMVSEESCSFMLTGDQAVSFGEEEDGFLSVFAFASEAEVSVKGLFYEFEGRLSPDKPLGLSNEFNGRGGEITVSCGTVLIIRTGMKDLLSACRMCL